MSGILQIAYEVIAPIFLVVGIAVLYTRRYKPDPRPLADLIFYILAPAIALDGLSKTNFSPSQLAEVGLMVVIFSALMSVIGWGAARLLHLDRRTESAFIITVVIMNAANYGVPVNEFAFGQAGREVAIVYFVMSSVVSNTLGVFLASRGNASVKRAFINVLRVPLVYATIFGLAFNIGQVKMPLPIERAITLLAQGTIPAMLVLLGMQLAQLRLKGNLRPVLVASGLRLLASPLVAIVVVTMMGMHGVMRNVSIVESSMPAAVFTGVLTAKYDSNAPFATAVILISTLASILTLSVLLSFLV